MSMDGSTAKGPAFFRREDLVGATDTPLGGRHDTVLGDAEQGDATGGTRKQAAQALRHEAKDFFPGGAGLEEASKFADLGDFGSLAAGIVEQATDLLVRNRQLILRGLAAGDFLLLVELGQG